MTTQLADRICTDPNICGGRPTVRGTRMPVKNVLEYLAAGDSAQEIVSLHDWLTLEDVAACIRFAADLVDHRYTVLRAA